MKPKPITTANLPAFPKPIGLILIAICLFFTSCDKYNSNGVGKRSTIDYSTCCIEGVNYICSQSALDGIVFTLLVDREGKPRKCGEK